MAQIDLKFATLKILDGYVGSALVNNPGNYAAGVLTIAITGLTTAAANGDTFTVSGESGTPTHTVTSHVETLGVTTQVTFTTAIASGGVTNASSITFTKTGAVNNVAGYVAGGTTILVDLITGVIANGDTFTVAGETGSPVHTVTGHLETSGNTTSLTFTTVLATGGVADDAVITFTRTGGLVNGAAGYATGVTTIVVDNASPILFSNGDTFVIAGETGLPVHTVLSHTETALHTTGLTFSPGLASFTADDAVLTLQPHSIDVTLGEGTLEYTEKRNIEYKLNLGKIKFVRLGDEVPVDVSMEFVWEFLTAASGDLAPTIEDALKKRNLASNWVTTGLDPCEPYAVDVQIVYTPPCGGIEKETITLQYFRYEELQHNFKDAQVSVKGKSNVLEAEVSRS